MSLNESGLEEANLTHMLHLDEESEAFVGEPDD